MFFTCINEALALPILAPALAKVSEGFHVLKCCSFRGCLNPSFGTLTLRILVFPFVDIEARL